MSSDSDFDDVGDAGDGGDGVEGVRVLGWESRSSHRPLGEWEKHTTVREREGERERDDSFALTLY